MSKPRICIKCGGKESDLIPFYQDRTIHRNICVKCRNEYNNSRYAKQRAEQKKQEEIASQPVSSEGVKLPSANHVEVIRYNAIHALSDKAKKEARVRVINALIEYFADRDKSTVTQRDIEKAVQQIANTGQNQSVANWYQVIIRVSHSDQSAFRWKALYRDWQKAIAQGGKL